MLLPVSPNVHGAMLMALSTVGFSSNDAVTKFVAAFMNVGQIMLVRGVIATALIGLLAWRAGALLPPRTAFHPAVALRVAAEVCSTVCFLVALPHVALANATALMQALPLVVTLAAALFLGESVGWRRWLSIATGFCGVVIIVQPGSEGFNAYGLLILGSVAACAVRDLATRSTPKSIPSLFLTFVTSLCVTVAGAVLVEPLGGWSPMLPSHLLFFGFGAALLLVGYHFLIMSNRVGDLSFIAPFRYVGLLHAGVLGFVFFGEVPTAVHLLGALIIVCSGIYMLYRERLRGQALAARASAAPPANEGV